MSLLVKQQYQQFPYPPVNAFALPRRDQGVALAWARGADRARARNLPLSSNGAGLRILVVGCGTLEALVVAQQHPQAVEVVALDLSAASLARLQQRLRLARVRDVCSLAAWRGQALPKVRCVEADLHQWCDGEFDYIVANNVLHHTPDAAAALAHLATMLRPGGLMRVVTYPAHSRLWVRYVGAYLRWHGLHQGTPNLVARSRQLISQLPDAHPVRSCFFAHSEHRTAAGIVDAFLHALERPLSPLQWQAAIAAAGLLSLGEDQHVLSRSNLLSELLPVTQALSDWQRLQMMDDVLELATNPVWCLYKGQAAQISTPLLPEPSPSIMIDADMLCSQLSIEQFLAQLPQRKQWRLPSQMFFEMGQGVHRAQAVLNEIELPVTELTQVLATELGRRVDRHGHDIPGLTLADYEVPQLLRAVEPWTEDQWQQLQAQLGDTVCLYMNTQRVPGDGLSQQAAYVQLMHGAQHALMDITFGVKQ